MTEPLKGKGVRFVGFYRINPGDEPIRLEMVAPDEFTLDQTMKKPAESASYVVSDDLSITLTFQLEKSAFRKLLEVLFPSRLRSFMERWYWRRRN